MIQIFGKSKCFDTKKAERFFKERGIKVHSVNLGLKAMSKGELTSVINAVGMAALINDKSDDYHLFMYLTDENKLEKLVECPALLKTPIVRQGKSATVGYCPDMWKKWE
jgi:arsenate reductase-like glutaredoxin family protein